MKLITYFTINKAVDMEESNIMTVNYLLSRFRAKSEQINVLRREGDIYLPLKEM